MEYKMLTEIRTESARAKRREIMKKTGKDFSGRRDKILVPRKDNLVQALATRPSMETLLVGCITIAQMEVVHIQSKKGVDNWLIVRYS